MTVLGRRLDVDRHSAARHRAAGSVPAAVAIMFLPDCRHVPSTPPHGATASRVALIVHFVDVEMS
jgi:hypothetical protein